MLVFHCFTRDFIFYSILGLNRMLWPAVGRNYVFISHVHSDHCEPETMKKLDPKVPILLMERTPNFLKNYLVGMGFQNLILIPAQKKTQVTPQFAVEMFGESFGHLCNNIIDSSVIFQFSDGKTVLNCNDNKPSEELCKYIQEHYKEIDLALVPAGGGSGYPAMYENYSFEEKLQISSKIIDNYANVFTKAVDILRPKVAVPVAGGFAIRGPLAETVNWVQCRRLDQMELVRHYQKVSGEKNTVTKILPMQPEMEMDVEARTYSKGEYHTWTDGELKKYFHVLTQEPVQALVHAEEPVTNIGRLVATARNNLWARQEKNGMKPDYRIYLDILTHDKVIEVDLASNQSQELDRSDSKALRPPYLRMKLDQDTMLEWLLGMEDYNMLDSGHRISFWREPVTQYVQEAYYLMSLLRLG
jgi:UDP-MurNAc hydroxylase